MFLCPGVYNKWALNLPNSIGYCWAFYLLILIITDWKKTFNQELVERKTYKSFTLLASDAGRRSREILSERRNEEPLQ